MSQIVACPKCKKQYKISARAAGQKMKCPACQTVFAAPAEAAVAAGQAGKQPAPAAPVPAKAAAAAPARPGTSSPLAGEPQLFPNEVPVGPDPLANHVIEDPGFASVDVEQVRRTRLADERRMGHRLDLDPLDKFKQDRANEKADKAAKKKQSKITILFGLVAGAVFTIVLIVGYIVALNAQSGFYILLYSFIAAMIVFVMVDLMIIQYVKDYDEEQYLWYALLPPYRFYYWFVHWQDLRAFVVAETVLFVPLLVNGFLVRYFDGKYHMGYFDF